MISTVWLRSICLAVALLCPSALVMAAQWELVTESASSVTYMDVASIANGPDKSREIWVRRDENSPFCSPIVGNRCITMTYSLHRYFPERTACELQLTYVFTDGTQKNVKSIFCSPNRIDGIVERERVWDYLFP